MSNVPLQITSRRHPLALADYLLVLALGLLFTTNGIHSVVIRQAIAPVFVFTWEWTMVLGGITATLGAVWRPLDHGLFAEAFGAAACAFGLATYTGAIIYVGGVTSPTWILTGSLVVGCSARSIQAYIDLQKVETASTHPPESFTLRPQSDGPE
jgi:hypothetical protein